MNNDKCSRNLVALTALATAGIGNVALAQDATLHTPTIEEIVVVGQSKTFANNVVTESMLQQQTPVTSVLASIDNLPGVSVQEGDTYGFDDWSTTVAMRGFQVNLDQQQIGTTIDGFPNGNSNYGGGSKANRFIDAANLGGVEVSQGTADIASRSNEALGGTLNFLTRDPGREQGFTVSTTQGQYDAERYYARFDSGALFGTETYAWISVSRQQASDWANGAAENERDHLAAKFVSSVGGVDLTGYISYDDTHEDNYQRLFSPQEFASNSGWDRLTDNWSGVPYIDQLYRRGWSTLRENTLGYLKAEARPTDGLLLSVGGYFHRNEGRGDWVPPYLVNVTDDAGGPESEALGAPQVNGGAPLGLIFFVDGNGVALAPTPGCVSSITFPYGGAGPEYDPACYPAGAIAVQSYRHTHYEKDRAGLTADFEWSADFQGVENVLRGGIWYEDGQRDEWRDWHKITDTRVGFEFDDPAYWRQYDREYPQDTFKWYLENSLGIGPVTATLGIKQFDATVERDDVFGATADAEIDSDSDVLFSGGLIYRTPVDGLELFAGYAENYKAIADSILEAPDSNLAVSPESATNYDIGFRYVGDRLAVAVTYYDIEFDDRIFFLSAESVTGPDYLSGDNGSYFNAGGIESDGVEVSASYEVSETLSIYAAYTMNESTYIGTGDPLVDAAQGVTPGNDVVGVAENLFVLSFDWVRGPIAAGISGKYTDERPVTLDNGWIAEDYWMVDAYLNLSGGELNPALQGIEAALVVNNLLDKNYLGGISGQGAWIGAPRTVALSISATF
ncbi:MAG: TonB-dependent receptor [Pseudomonadales bacterium]